LRSDHALQIVKFSSTSTSLFFDQDQESLIFLFARFASQDQETICSRSLT